MPGERKPMSIDEVEAVLVDLPEEQLDDLIDRVAVRRGVSLDTDSEWSTEIARRVGEYDHGEVTGIPMEETLAKLRAMLK